MHILLTPTFRDSAIASAHELLPPEFTLVLGDPDEGGYLDKVRNADALMGYFPGLSAEAWAAAKGRVRLAQMLSAGYDRVDIQAAIDAEVPIAMNGGANAIAVAEHAVMLMLAALRSLPDGVAETRAGVWRPTVDTRRYYELHGRTVGIVGLGNIGLEVARRVQAFGAPVIYFDPQRRTAEQEARLGIEFVELDTLFERADVITLHAPSTPQTRHLVNSERIAAMKPLSLLVNTARADLIDEAALLSALDAAHILGAALDTVDPEPPPSDHLLLRHPRAIVTPHIAGPTEESWPRRISNAYENIARVARGEAPQWIIPEMR
jgi:phosphoglycerate dehydrogenase-like enzyme